MTKKTMISVIGLILASFTGCTDGGADPASNNTGGNVPVVTPYVQDLIGIRGHYGGGSLKERGFVWVKTEKLDASSYTYWKHRQSSECLKVQTTNGRYVSLRTIPAYDCEKK